MLYKPIEVYKIAVDIFGEDRVDLDVMNWHDPSGTYSITILFPELEMTNSANAKHTIYDMYVRFIVGYVNLTEECISVSFLGNRGMFTLKEACSGYSHSHMNGSATFTNFCLGSSVFGTLLHDVMRQPDETKWNLLLLSVENYLKWESLEGGPYRLISNMGYGNYAASRPDLVQAFNQIAKGIPPSAFAYTDQLVLMEDDRDLIEYYDEKSPVKTLVRGLTKETAEQLMRDHTNTLARYTFHFIDRTVTKRIIPADEFSGEQGPISKDVVNHYNQIIKTQLNSFNNNLRYEQLKGIRKDTVFGEILPLEQAQTSNYPEF